MRVHFSTDDVAPRDREQYWIDVVAKHVLKITLADRADPATFRTEFDAHVAGRFTLFEWQTSHRIGSRTPSDVSRDNSGRFQLVGVPRGETITAFRTRARPEEVRLAPGDFCVSSDQWSYEPIQKGRAYIRGLTIPQAALSPMLAGGGLTHPIAVRGASPLGSLLGAAFDAAIAQIPLLSPELGEAVLQNLCGLVALACGALEEGRWNGRESLRAARLEAAKRYVDQHLAEPGLTPVSTAATLHMSLRQLHLLFEPTGITFAQYVTRQRLLHCRTTLTSPTGAGRSVADIAFGWGFNSLATFYRAFEREFGLSPTALRLTAATGESG
jgi:AraC-like DNA-binding protein